MPKLFSPMKNTSKLKVVDNLPMIPEEGGISANSSSIPRDKDEGSKALIKLCKMGTNETRPGKIVDLLTSREDVDVNYRQPGAFEQAALHFLAISGDVESAQVLLERRRGVIDVNIRDREGLTPLHTSVIIGQEIFSQVLLNNEAGINLLDKNNCPPLYYALKAGKKNITQLLVNRDADVGVVIPEDEYTRGRNVPLILVAAYNGDRIQLEAMLGAGADLGARNKRGVSAKDIYRSQGHDLETLRNLETRFTSGLRGGDMPSK